MVASVEMPFKMINHDGVVIRLRGEGDVEGAGEMGEAWVVEVVACTNPRSLVGAARRKGGKDVGRDGGSGGGGGGGGPSLAPSEDNIRDQQVQFLLPDSKRLCPFFEVPSCILLDDVADVLHVA